MPPFVKKPVYRVHGVERFSETIGDWVEVEEMNGYHAINALMKDFPKFQNAREAAESPLIRALIARIHKAYENGEIEVGNA